MKEILIGFDVREMWIPTNILWEQSRKNRNLLRLDTDKPLSVDPTVWQSIFDIDNPTNSGVLPKIEALSWEKVPSKTKYQTEQWRSIFENSLQLRKPEWIGPREAWGNLEQLINHVTQYWATWKPSWVIAITTVVSDDREIVNLKSYDIKPKHIFSEWELLGYDVADYFFTSFLTNATYSSQEKNDFQKTFKKQLNKHHLFETIEQAEAYVPVAESRDEQHGEMYSYGIYLVENRTDLLS